jgi:hypothetical protein
LPTLTKRYGEHAALAQDAEDADILYMTVSYALRCRDELNTLTALVADAKLAESVILSYTLGKLLQDAPSPLPKSKIFSEFKVYCPISVKLFVSKSVHFNSTNTEYFLTPHRNSWERLIHVQFM